MKKTVLALTAALALAACQIPMDADRDNPATFTKLNAPNTPKVVNFSKNPVRTFVQGPDQTVAEVSGALCVIQSKQFRTEFRTPSWVKFPMTKGPLEPLKLTCKGDGKSAKGVLVPGQIVTGYSVSTGDLLTSLVATAIVAPTTIEASKAANIWGFRFDPPVVRVLLE